MGVVFGDIGTSPLYAVRESFYGPVGVDPTPANVLGILSLMFWALILVISVKYLLIVLRADNAGEGGILALLALARAVTHRGGRLRTAVIALGIFGAALLYGDGILTPAISVLGAVEGLAIAAPAVEHLVLPITVGILVGLFLFQRRGTARVGTTFGPIILLWFLVLGTLGVRGILLEPSVLGAIHPGHAVGFFASNGAAGFVVLGAVFLVVTGGEALYADMGHLGARPIRLAWFTVVLPGLLLNYFGQGALVLAAPGAIANPFFELAPRWGLIPLLALATAASVIASQAIISGAFSLTRQAINLGFAPRLLVRHTSGTMIGQIYVPAVNWALMVGTVWLVFEFKTSSNVASAYGVAVTTTMVITTLLMFLVMREVWRWPLVPAACVTAFFLGIDLAFFAATMLKVLHGGWVPLGVAALLFVLMTTWRDGRGLLARRIMQEKPSLAAFLDELSRRPPARAAGTAIYLTGDPRSAPIALTQNPRHNRILHKQIILLNVRTLERARAPAADRLAIEDLGMGFHRVVASHGFMETPNVAAIVAALPARDFPIDPAKTTFFLGRQHIVPSRHDSRMAYWRQRLFAAMARLAQEPTAFFRVPAERVIEVGTRLKL